MRRNNPSYNFASGSPAIIVSISLAVTQANGYGSKATCWLDVKSGLIWTFIAPTFVVISVSIKDIVYGALQ